MSYFLPFPIQYCPSGSVTDLAKAMKGKGEKLSEDLVAYILREVIAGLCYLHSCGILHRDVKGQNVLLTKTARVKLIDFGTFDDCDMPYTILTVWNFVPS